MKLNLYKVTDGVKELVLTECAMSIYFDNKVLAARFYPSKNASVYECTKIIVIPVGYFAEIVDE